MITITRSDGTEFKRRKLTKAQLREREKKRLASRAANRAARGEPAGAVTIRHNAAPPRKKPGPKPRPERTAGAESADVKQLRLRLGEVLALAKGGYEQLKQRFGPDWWLKCDPIHKRLMHVYETAEGRALIE
jgi:sRNA-binding protein